MQNSNEEVIDLTSLDYYVPCKQRRLICDDIIDLVNDSLDADTEKTNNDIEKNIKNQRKTKVKGKIKKTTEKNKEESSSKAGLCSICWEKLGKNPLASTKCGHVYCLPCLEKSLKFNKHCPTCRYLLKGATAYHPLYLELG